jgi:hypothetical protein
VNVGAVPEVTALVLGSRGGARLNRALASVAWTGDRIVLDPAGRLGEEPLPPSVRRLVDAARACEVTRAPWLLLLQEDEVTPPALAAAVGAEVRGATPRMAYRIPRQLRALGATLRVGAPVRLARGPGARLRLTAALTVELRAASGRPGRLAAHLEAWGAPSLAEAVQDVEAEAAAYAELLRAQGVRPRLHRLMVAPIVAAGGLLSARAAARLPWARWSLAVLAGYRPAVAYAKLWELRRLGASTPR